MTVTTWLGAVSGILLIASVVSAFLGYRRFSRNFDGEHAQAMVENALDRLRDNDVGPPSEFGTINMQWYREESDRTVRRIYGAVGAALPDSYAYCAIILAGIGALLGFVAVLISH